MDGNKEKEGSGAASFRLGPEISRYHTAQARFGAQGKCHFSDFYGIFVAIETFLPL